jgi:sarcosine oxidase
VAARDQNCGVAHVHTDVAVVGGGLLGLATARAWLQRGARVVVLEQARVGHMRAGSKGASRIFRLGYDDPVYVRMAVAARPHWSALERACGCTLLTPTVQLTFGGDADLLLRALEQGGAVGACRMSRAEIGRAFRDFAAPGDAVYEPTSAVIDAEGTLAALRGPVGDALREETRVTRVAERNDGARLETTGGEVDAAVVVMCPGASAAIPIAGVPTPERFATLEHVAYFRPRHGLLPELPIFISYDEPALYGLPTAALGAYKLAFHHAGERVDPARVDLTPRPAAVDALRRAARDWIPQFDPEPVLVEACLYDNTVDEDFVLDRRGRIVIGAGTSGHGFKFGPLLGELLADLATGVTPSLDLARFALDRAESRS